MTIEETYSARDDFAGDLDAAMTDGACDVAAVQLTLADAERVTMPQGQRVIVVPVTPGETVTLPTDTEQGLLAEIGPQGNLAFVVDGRTIILQGYVQANEQAPVTVVTNDGDRIDVVAVVAQTDPSLDIQTAAGPAAGSQGESATGSGIFTPFPAGAGLGGLNAEGVLGGTALQYKLVTDQTKTFVLDEDRDRDIGIVNALPHADPDTATTTQGIATNYQLMLVIDTSGSMADEVTRPDGTVTTRMELQKAAVIAMLESYAMSTSGTVNIKMVQFSDGASYFGGTGQSTFVDVTNPANLAAVIAAISVLSPALNTDYDTALATAQLGIMDASWLSTNATTKGLVYFFSDGRPQEDSTPVKDSASSYPGGDTTNALNQTEEDIWEGRTPAAGFATGLADKGVVSIAVGLGADIANDVTALGQLGRVAYYNETFPDQSVIVVNDENQLIAEIIQTVPATVTGNVLTNDDPGADGYGDPHIIAVSAIIDVDTTSQTVTDTATGYKVETNNGTLVIDKTTGDFSYTAAPGSGGHEDTFTYTIQDAFLSDTDSATLTVTIAPPTLVHGTGPAAGTSGNDFIIGDDADNIISAAAGTDSVQGGYGNDTLDGGVDNDALYGQEGNDLLTGDDGNDMLLGGNGDDQLNGGDGIDALAGGAGNDILDGGDGNDTLLGGNGNDQLNGGDGVDALAGGDGNDKLDGGADDDALNGQDGNDVLNGGDGNDTLLGGNGNDQLNGGDGIDVLDGGAGNDTLDGGDDSLTDILSGGIGEDTLIWRGTDDTYSGGADAGNATTGAPGDILVISNASSIDFTAIDDGKIEDIETLRMNGGAGTAITLNADDIISDFESGNLNPGGSGSGGAYDNRPVLRVDGDAGDSVDLSGGGWFQAAGATGFPAGFTLYVHEASGATPGAAEDAYVLVQNGVTVTGI